MVLAHPLRGAAFTRPWADARTLFDALEALNGDESTQAGTHVLELARRCGLPATGGSDAHSALAIGRRATLFGSPIGDEQDLIRALRAGACAPVELGALPCAFVLAPD